MKHRVRILHLEDDINDAELIAAKIAMAGISVEFERVETEEDFLNALRYNKFDIILCDYALPSYDGMAALEAKRRLCPNVPFIFVSGTMGEEPAIDALRLGATDYVLKHRLSRLVPAVTRALNEAEMVRTRMKAEQSLRESEAKFREIFDSIIDLFYRTDAEGRVLIVSPSAASVLEYSPEELVGKNLLDCFLVEEDRQRFKTMLEEFSEVREFEAPMLTKQRKVVWVSTNARLYPDERGGILGVQGVARDITDRKHAEDELRSVAQKFKKALDGSIAAMSAIVEMRDPYTSGHQKRVAQLAGTIASELALSGEQIEAVYTAAAIHDVGKISVPSEILSKPSRLNHIETMFVRRHPQEGYSILANIDFPWPLAEIVYQHHERFDGSGYPRGLTAVDMLAESRIIAVADVVEAMASHRPYRPALGIETALCEIEEHSGELYCPEVVAACLRLFREKDYVL